MRTIVILTMAALLLAAAAPAQQSAPGAKKIDPCALVTQTDVQTASSQSVAAPKPNTTNPSVCDFKVGAMGNISLMAMKLGSGESADKTIAELRKRNTPVTEVKGVGDRAFYAEMGFGMTQLNAYKGASYVIITMMLPTTTVAKQKTIAETLMNKALAKL